MTYSASLFECQFILEIICKIRRSRLGDKPREDAFPDTTTKCRTQIDVLTHVRPIESVIYNIIAILYENRAELLVNRISA